jgi:hypothetical protein
VDPHEIAVAFRALALRAVLPLVGTISSKHSPHKLIMVTLGWRMLLACR